MNYEEAKAKAKEYLSVIGERCKVDLVLLENATIERRFGWVFFYDSRKHLATGAVCDALGGNAPFIITRLDGSIHETGTSHSIDYYILAFEREHSR